VNGEGRPDSGPHNGSALRSVAAGTDAPLGLDDLIAFDPRLAVLLAEARSVSSPDWADYARLKRKLSGLVGWRADADQLGSSHAYNLGVAALVDALRL